MATAFANIMESGNAKWQGVLDISFFLSHGPNLNSEKTTC